MKKTIIAGAISLLFTQTSFAAENIALDDITVKANRFERKDTETTYASEIHTAKEIEASGAATLYDFLAQQSSVNLGSYFGNKATPTMNLHGYGGDNGNQNVVITLDGQRLNNIDSAPQLLGAISLGNIERIEISKGSGSVIYGDGATAGVIQIYTKNKTGVTVSTSFGDFGQQNHYINAGLSEKYFDLYVSAAHDSNDGYSKTDNTGHKDEFTSDTQNVKLKIKPTDSLRLLVSGTNSRNDVRYPNELTNAQFNSDPSQNGKPSTKYTSQSLDTAQWKVGVEYDITSKIKIAATHYREDKASTYSSKTDFVNKSDELSISYDDDIVSAIAGLQSFDGNRDGGFDVTSKDSRAWFLNTEYRPTWLTDALTVSAGVREEEVKYQYAPTAGTSLNDKENLNAWDIGANYRLSPKLSVFTNYNKAYLAPNIDSFFGFDTFFNTIFNGFIKPQQSKTLNIGLNHVAANNRLKATLFYANLDNEIYLDKSLGNYTNTNLDESHKYGLELQDYFKITDNLNASVIYNYTRSIIDKELREDGSSISGKDLPSAPKHTIVANVNYKFLEHASMNLNQTWRSSTYASEDFLNNASQRQGHYESTNIALNYQYKNMQFFTSVNNLFEHENSVQVRNDVIYPIDFVRTFRVGMKADF
ncbi:TonB-dependent receptor [Methylotenera sp.]|uniref:TonB-dependent receptor n=1 Tax=Methylotenera sp. TaxID=2051956 RepID=UPI00248887AD|nr:TonB-dependent receptor [Methylotenera sp.]MDI1298645.1 TonB-dependent receptor [Methylotenera sp.]